jgi:hypothetical protein
MPSKTKTVHAPTPNIERTLPSFRADELSKVPMISKITEQAPSRSRTAPSPAATQKKVELIDTNRAKMKLR